MPNSIFPLTSLTKQEMCFKCTSGWGRSGAQKTRDVPSLCHPISLPCLGVRPNHCSVVQPVAQVKGFPDPNC